MVLSDNKRRHSFCVSKIHEGLDTNSFLLKMLKNNVILRYFIKSTLNYLNFIQYINYVEKHKYFNSVFFKIFSKKVI